MSNKLFIQNRANTLNDLLGYYDETTNLLAANALITWNDLVPPQKTIVMKAREFGIPSIIVEHGMKAVSDYQYDLHDIKYNMGGKTAIADNYFLWGNKSKSIMADAGVDPSKLHVIGSPIIWNHEYVYSNGNDTRCIGANFGETVTDPATGVVWNLDGCRSFIPKYDGGDIIVFFPPHIATPYYIEKTRIIWDQIKHRNDVFVKLSADYMRDFPDNPFIDLIKMEDASIRREKMIGIDINHVKNLPFIKSLLRRTRLLITAMPGTINGIAWSMGVQTLVPRIDWFWRDNSGEIVYDIHPPDYQCEERGINEAITDILNDGDDRCEMRSIFAEEFMGVNLGNPTTNMRSLIDKISKSR